MSNLPGPEQLRQLLVALKTTVSEFTAREETLNSDYQKKIAWEKQQHEEAIEELNNRLSGQIDEADSRLRQAKEATEAKFQKRRTAIVQANKAAAKQALDRIDDREGRRKHKVQMGNMAATRAHEAGLEAAERKFEEFKNFLANENALLITVEAQARNYFKGYGKFLRMLSAAPENSNFSTDENRLLNELRELLAEAQTGLNRFRKFPLPHFFRYRWIWLALVLWQIPMVPILKFSGVKSWDYNIAGASAGGLIVLGFILHLVGKSQATPLAKAIAEALVRARKVHDVALERAAATHTRETAEVEKEFQTKTAAMQEQWNNALNEAAELRELSPGKIEAKKDRVNRKNEEFRRVRLERLQCEHAECIDRAKRDAETRRCELNKSAQEKESRLKADFEAAWRTLESDWKKQIEPLYASVHEAIAGSENIFPAWRKEVLDKWTPPQKFIPAAKFAQLAVDVENLAGGIPKDKRLALPGQRKFSLPVLLTHPEQGSVLFETTEPRREEVVGALNNIILRLLEVAPPGRLSFTIIDPVELGQNFAGVMHLADYAEHLINSRIWTQTAQIEQKLADLNEHMEKVIQMYLRNEYETIAEYNEQAGTIAEKYHFLVIADFPTNFSEVAIRRLLSIAASGARCGVFTLIHWDRRQVPNFPADDLRRSSVVVQCKNGEFFLAEKNFLGTKLLLEMPPAAEATTEFVHKIGKASRDSNRVEVPFSEITPDDNEIWSSETTSELQVPIGRTGATKFQYLAIGKGTRQHALIAGKTGSGKSTLFHVIITNLALWCSPEQVEFYLIDFKKGVEFKCYASHALPHARVVAIESDREFGLSVLQRLDEELKRRGELFRKLGVQDLPGYKAAGGTEPLPRSLLMIDEFQEYFTEDDKISQSAGMLLDRIVRQGRAFGIHVILGSQTLGGAYTVARTTLGQMVIRVALQCNEADAYLIMDDTNPAPRLLSRPGEGIYNDEAGAVQGNSPFQVVWLSDKIRDDYLEKVSAKVASSGKKYPAPIVFEGDAPANVGENPELTNLLEAKSIKPAVAPRIFLGAPNSIKGPTEAIFYRQSGNNLLIVGQRDEAALAICAAGLVSLTAQFPRDAAQFIVFDGSAPGMPQREYLEKLVAQLPCKVTLAKNADVTDIMNNLAAEMKKRTEDERAAAEAPPIFLFFLGLQKFGKLRYEEDFSFSSDAEATSPSAQLNKIICEGTSLGFHVIAACDTYNNVNRFVSKKAFSEFEMRVLFQMSASDSASLIDSPKGGSLGLHRALFYNEQEGYLEIFRPYALPDQKWIEDAAKNLSRLLQ